MRHLHSWSRTNLYRITAYRKFRRLLLSSTFSEVTEIQKYFSIFKSTLIFSYLLSGDRQLSRYLALPESKKATLFTLIQPNLQQPFEVLPLHNTLFVLIIISPTLTLCTLSNYTTLFPPGHHSILTPIASLINHYAPQLSQKPSLYNVLSPSTSAPHIHTSLVLDTLIIDACMAFSPHVYTFTVK